MQKARMVSIILVTAFLIGCSSPASTGAEPSGSTKTNISMNITSFSIFADSDGNMDQEAADEWVEYMADSTGITIKLASNSNFYSELVPQISSGKTTGLVCMNPIYINMLIDKNKILPIDEYLKDNKTWNSLPESFRKSFELNGHIWAIPRTTSYTTKATSLRTDWMAAVNKKMPSNSQELYELGKAFTEGDPDKDGNSKNNYLYGGYNACWIDLLASMGVYIDSTAYSSIAYDPTQDCMVDSMFKPEAKAALQYLKDMMKAGIIDKDSVLQPNVAKTNSYNGLYGSVNAWPGYGQYYAGVTWAKNQSTTLDLSKDEDYEYATSLYEVMPPFKTDYTIPYATSFWGYVLTKGTKDPKAIVNAFVDLFFSSQKTFLACYLGIPDSYEDKGSNTYALKTGDNARPIANLCTAADMVFPNGNYALITNGDASPSAVRLAKESSKYYTDYYDQYTKSGQLIYCPALYYPSGDTLQTQFQSIYNSYNRLMLTLANDNVTVDQALEEYRENVKLYQIDTILKESNAAIGKTSKQVIE